MGLILILIPLQLMHQPTGVARFVARFKIDAGTQEDLSFSRFGSFDSKNSATNSIR
jgi:hypothetical protein